MRRDFGHICFQPQLPTYHETKLKWCQRFFWKATLGSPLARWITPQHLNPSRSKALCMGMLSLWVSMRMLSTSLKQ